ncbi:hypothetical protein Apa02nite_063520 [Actinoplanes palleronii]|uniref:Transposase n=1 Tax=Actinoplanes palleronii TaxID=113570 RepID=A0ABQ4BHV2_9ACTN|nr:hypothetical protein Apa02nite_063520 [Actinoplanes palleronii]
MKHRRRVIVAGVSVVVDRPVREILVRAGTQTNCNGIARILADLEPAEQFAFVDAHESVWTGDCDDEAISWCVEAVRRGVVAELTEQGQGELPAVRFVLRRILVHPIDSAPHRNEQVGRMAVTEGLRRLTEITG